MASGMSIAFNYFSLIQDGTSRSMLNVAENDSCGGEKGIMQAN